MATLQRQLCLLAPLLLSAIAANAQGTIKPRAISFATFMFRAADGTEVQADSGTLIVRADHKSGDAGTISLPIVRFRSHASSRRPPVVYISGGSGSGIAAARGNRFSMFIAMRGAADVITLDLRGAGRSRPRISCPAGLTGLSSPITYPAITSILTVQARACADSLRRAGVDLQRHNIREVVADLDDLRSALGVAKISLVGTSTGTQIALEYMRRHPMNVDRVVLAGVQAPDQNQHMPSEQDSVVRRLSSQLGGPVTLVSQISQVLDSLRARPKSVVLKNGSGDSTIVGIGPFDVQLLVSATLGDRRQMALLPQLIGAATRGNYVPLAGMKMAAAQQGITSAYEALMDCQTGEPEARRNEALRQSKSALLGIATLDFPEVCAAWGVRSLDASYRRPVKSPVPTLVISGTLDGRTPVRNARDAIRGLPRSTHLIIDGASHGDDLFLSSPEIVPIILKFLTPTESALPKIIRLIAQ